MQYLESGISSVESRIRDCLGFIPLHLGQLKTQSKLRGLRAPENAERNAYHWMIHRRKYHHMGYPDLQKA